MLDVDGVANVKNSGFFSCINFFSDPSDSHTAASFRYQFLLFLYCIISREVQITCPLTALSHASGLLPNILSDPGGYEPERLKGLSENVPELISSFIEAILSSDEDAMQEKLAELADYASNINSFQAWFNLGFLAHRLFFHQAASSRLMRRAQALLIFRATMRMSLG